MTDKPEGTKPEGTRKWRWLVPVVRFPVTRIVLAFAAIALASFLWVALLFWVADLVLWILGLVPPQNSWELMTLPVALHLTYVGYVRLVEQRSPSELAGAGAVRELARGILVGAALPAAVVGLVAALGVYRVVALNPWTSLVPPFAAAVSNAYMWECLSRGILLRITEESLGTWLALLISSLLVGVLLAFSPSATVVSTVAILEANLLLGAAYLLTRRLWMAIGINFAWNFTQAGIFGVKVPGNEAGGLLDSQLSGPNLISGGSFGVGPSIFAIVMGLALGAVFLVLAHRRGHFMKPFWSNAKVA
jgi:membrane protease YdiL (CAAX protease family)